MREFLKRDSAGNVSVDDMSRELLAEIPGQLLDWMASNHIAPNPSSYGAMSPMSAVAPTLSPSAIGAPVAPTYGGGGWMASAPGVCMCL